MGLMDISYPKETILVVDDTPDNLTLMSNLLKETYKVKVANNGEKALKIALGDNPPDLILLDIMMPEMDGYEVCLHLKSEAKTRDIPVIFLTAKADIEDEKKGLDLGAVDYITKPVSPPIVLARIKTHLQLKAAADFLRDKNEYLETQVANRTQEVRALQTVTMLAMASLAETRDAATGYHIRRTQLYVEILAKALRKHPKYAAFLTDEVIGTFIKSAPLHDIGKVGIPDCILMKPGRLSPEEFEIMKTHSAIGCAAIENAEQQMGKKISFLDCVKETAYYHHEKWDGAGYPAGIKGDAIPLSARLMAVADVYDALISPRVYKRAMSHEEAAETIMAGRGTHFDPDIVDAFEEVSADFAAIARRYADRDNQKDPGV